MLKLSKNVYRPEVDGLRAIAIIAVLGAHYHIPFMAGGYVGVDVFFIISGYLITSIIHTKLQTNTFSFKEFYLRRVLRIAPALLITLILSAIAAYYIFMPAELIKTGKSGIAAALSYANIYYWFNMGYFDGAAIEKPFLHTWSLSVEEQFYLFFPLFIAMAYRFFHTSYKHLLIFIALISFFIATWGAFEKPTAAFFLPVTRAWELLLGGFIALNANKSRGDKVNSVLINTGLGLIIFSSICFSEATIFPGASALLPTVGAFLIISYSTYTKSFVSRVLTTHFMLFIGKISYSLYLFHWPILVFAQYYLMRPLFPFEKFSFIIITIFLAFLNWKFIEQPLRITASNKIRRNLVITGTLFISSMFIFSAFITEKGFPERFPNLEAPTPIKHKKAKENKFNCFIDLKYSNGSEYNIEKCNINSGKGQKVLLVGDSYANHYVSALKAELSPISYALYQLGAGSCPIQQGLRVAEKGCTNFTEQAFKKITTLKPDIVIMSANWWSYSRDATLTDSIEKTIARYQSIGAQVIFIGISPVYPSKVPYIALRQQNSGIDTYSYFIEFDNQLDTRLQEAVVESQASYFSVYDILCIENTCQYGNKESLFHTDKGHLTKYASSMLIKKMREKVPL